MPPFQVASRSTEKSMVHPTRAVLAWIVQLVLSHSISRLLSVQYPPSEKLLSECHVYTAPHRVKGTEMYMHVLIWAKLLLKLWVAIFMRRGVWTPAFRCKHSQDHAHTVEWPDLVVSWQLILHLHVPKSTSYPGSCIHMYQRMRAFFPWAFSGKYM